LGFVGGVGDEAGAVPLVAGELGKDDVQREVLACGPGACTVGGGGRELGGAGGIVWARGVE
jgi:hypothetical protein